MSPPPRLEIARRQIEFARNYLFSLLEDIEDSLWFTMPENCQTHVAWQVGHLAMAEYGLCLFRQRGRQSVDTELMSSRFRKQFSRSSVPNADSASYPTPEEILATLEAVHRQVLTEMDDYSDQQIDEKIDMPYAGYDTKLGALLFCSHHELLHAGQIGLLRRLLGKEPVR